jgi:hypothetical protein
VTNEKHELEANAHTNVNYVEVLTYDSLISSRKTTHYDVNQTQNNTTQVLRSYHKEEFSLGLFN